MADNEVEVMRGFLIAAIEGAGVGTAAQIHWDHGGGFFSIDGADVEVVLEKGQRADFWRVRDVYNVADLKEGGQRLTGATVGKFDIGDEIAAAKAAVMKIVEARLDSALDAAA